MKTLKRTTFLMIRGIHFCVCTMVSNLYLSEFYNPVVEANIGDWHTYTNSNFIQEILVRGDDIWCATSGGIVQLNITNGTTGKYTNVDGLGDVDVLALSSDRKSRLWFGTNGGGVSLYDPFHSSWITYTEFDGIADNVVGAVLATPNRVWIGTEEGISLFVWNKTENDYYWKENYLAERRVPVKKVRDLLDWNDEIWVGMEGGVARAQYHRPELEPNLQDSTNWTFYNRDDGLSDNHVYCLTLVDSMVWAGTGQGVSVFQESLWVPYNLGMPEDTQVFDLLSSGKEVWAATSQGLYEYTDEWTPALLGESMRGLTLDNNQKLWIGTEEGGVITMENEEWNRYVTEGPARNNIERVAVDQKEYIWVTTIAPGYIAKACRFAEDHWTFFDESDGLKTGQGLPGLMVDQQGRKWFGSWGDGVDILDDRGTLEQYDDILQHFDEENSLLRGIIQNPQYVVITDIAQDNLGNFWFLNYLGMESGLAVCDSNFSRWIAYSTRDGLVYPEVQSLAIDHQGIKWIGATQEGMSRFDDNGTPFDKSDDDPNFAWQTYSEDNIDPYLIINSDNVTSICVDGKGVVWIGTADGLMRFNKFYFSSVDGLVNKSVNVVAADARDNIWVGTSGGVSFFDATIKTWTPFTVETSGLVSNNVQDIAINNKTGEIWMATDRGLSCYESGIVSPVKRLDGVTIFPQPFFPKDDDETLTFSKLTDGSAIFIYSFAGELVREITAPRNNLNQAHWDGRNENGSLVASGIYLYAITDEAGQLTTGKIALIR